MKNMLLAAVIAGVALAGVILYLTGGSRTKGELMNVEDGLPVQAEA